MGLIFYSGRRAVAVSLREPGAGTFLPLAASSRSGERYSERERAKEMERKIERKRKSKSNALLNGSLSLKLFSVYGYIF